MVSIVRLRRHLPLVVAVLVLLLVAVLIGFACACFADTPTQAAERAITALAALPTVVAAWSLAVALTLGAAALAVHPASARERASPAMLQRFLF